MLKNRLLSTKCIININQKVINKLTKVYKQIGRNYNKNIMKEYIVKEIEFYCWPYRSEILNYMKHRVCRKLKIKYY